MAKKLNRKLVYVVIAVGGFFFIIVAIFGFNWLKRKNPHYCLEKAHQAVASSDFVTAEQYYLRAYGRTELDKDKIDILFEMAQFHLTVGPKHEPNWRNAIQCWNTVLNINPQHIEARRKLLDYFYQAADSGNSGLWKQVDEHATKLLEVFEQTKEQPVREVLMAAARASYEIALQGSETYRQERAERAAKLLEQLKKLAPDDVEVYEYMAQVALLKGELDEAKGVKDARSTAQKNAQTILQQAIQNVADKGKASAYLAQFELRQVQADPNTLPLFRKKVEDLTQTYPKSDQLFSVLSASYELHGTIDRRKELELAVQNAEKAQEAAGGQNVMYAIRTASLLYRIGSLYEEKEPTERAIKIAETALTFPDATILRGPKESAARQNRFMLQSFLARCFVDQAVMARKANDEKTAKLFYDLVNKAVEEITQLVGGSTTLIARQWQGMLALAENNEKQAFRLLYKVYEEMKALDKTGEMSSIDAYLCYTLSRLAATQGSLGMQREFLEKALYNRNSIAPEKPSAILDYVNIMLNLQAGSRVVEILDSYIRVYGESTRVRLMRIQANLQAAQFEEAGNQLSKMDSSNPEVAQTRLLLANLQLNRLLGRQALEKRDFSAEEQKKISQLRVEQDQLLNELMQKKPDMVDSQILVSVCRERIVEGKLEEARKLISPFAASQKENVNVQLLKLQLDEPDPNAISPARQQELTETVLRQIKDPVRQALLLGQHYRALGKVEQAKELYEKAYQQSSDSVEIASDYFSFLLEQKKILLAEEIFAKIRNQNPDGHEGNLFLAQLEIARENYPAALRRLDECISLRPGSSAAMMLKSQVYLLQKNYGSAVENARLAFQVDPQNGMAARMLALTIYERNRNLSAAATPEQTTELEKAIGIAMFLNPADWRLQGVYAEAIEEKDPQRALAMRQALLKGLPNTSNALMLGNMAIRMARTEKDSAKQNAFIEIAGNAYQQAYQMEPSNREVQNAYIEYLRATRQRQKATELFAKDESALWRFYLSDGQYTQAAEIIEKLLAKNENDIELSQALVEAYKGLEQWEKMKAPLGLLGRQKLTADQEIWLIQKYLDTGDNEEAEKRLASFQERYPVDDRGQMLAAWLNMYQGNMEKAIELVQKYLEKDTRAPAGWRLKGRIHRLMDQPQQAIDALQRSKSVFSDPMVRIELSTIYNQMGQIEAAIGELVGGLNEPQVPPQMLQMLESLYVHHQRVNELAQFYQQMIGKYPNSLFWYTKAGLFLFGQKNYSDALTLLEKAWNLSRQGGSPGDHTALNNYLKTLIEAQQMEKALAVAAGLIDTPLAPVAYCNIATVQAKQGQNDKAIESFSKAIDKASGKSSMILGTLTMMGRVLGTEFVEKWCNQKLATDSKYMPAHIMLADIEEQRGAYNKAMAHVVQCLEQVPENSPDWMEFSNRKAMLLLAAYSKTADTGYFEQAVQQLEANLKMQPNNATMMNNLAYLFADNNVQINKAVDYSRRAFQVSPADPVFLDTHAYALCRTGEFAQAERYLRRAIQLCERGNTPATWDIYKHLGMALQGQKKNKEARTAFEKALELGKELPEKEKIALEQMIRDLKP
ncbi:MAG: tetratricopeptide repeat protein [Planctomycetes bacterium]|nr:tetratricopeptide repeat protein [Planctomycetota bacterium]